MEITDQNVLEVSPLGGVSSNSLKVESDGQLELIAKALSHITKRRILYQIKEKGLDVSRIAADLDMTEANISAQIKKLEEAGLIECSYKAGQHGVRKISELKYKKIIITF
ncbi:MAG: helix-turn-helix domain-containing protein [Candidatus Lokiarchaeota archaeon]|nr:helix-turn-helix domain-containing protein [Candidatus Lokiarchaeota archaeon]MBD3338678.1 helix-turn-helix domain-containing protein [Candidatus Lokiarchaeota archaeon]